MSELMSMRRRQNSSTPQKNSQHHKALHETVFGSLETPDESDLIEEEKKLLSDFTGTDTLLAVFLIVLGLMSMTAFGLSLRLAITIPPKLFEHHNNTIRVSKSIDLILNNPNALDQARLTDKPKSLILSGVVEINDLFVFDGSLIHLVTAQGRLLPVLWVDTDDERFANQTTIGANALLRLDHQTGDIEFKSTPSTDIKGTWLQSECVSGVLNIDICKVAHKDDMTISGTQLQSGEHMITFLDGKYDSIVIGNPDASLVQTYSESTSVIIADSVIFDQEVVVKDVRCVKTEMNQLVPTDSPRLIITRFSGEYTCGKHQIPDENGTISSITLKTFSDDQCISLSDQKSAGVLLSSMLESYDLKGGYGYALLSNTVCSQSVLPTTVDVKLSQFSNCQQAHTVSLPLGCHNPSQKTTLTCVMG